MKNVQQELAELKAKANLGKLSLEALQELSVIVNLFASEVKSEITRRSNYASKHIPTRKND